MISDFLMYWTSRPLVSTYTDTMLTMDVVKHEPLPAGPRIIAANHLSTTDPFFVAAMVRTQSYILIKDLLFQVPILGEYLRRSGHIPVKAGQGQQAINAALEHLRAGHTVIIFPEGELSPEEGGFNKARTGVARIALESGAPVIPVGIHLQRNRMHTIRSTVRGQVAYGRWYLRGPYYMTVGHPLHLHGDVQDRAHVRLSAERVMHQIIELAYESEERMGQTPAMFSGAFGAE